MNGAAEIGRMLGSFFIFTLIYYVVFSPFLAEKLKKFKITGFFLGAFVTGLLAYPISSDDYQAVWLAWAMSVSYMHWRIRPFKPEEITENRND